MAVPRRITRGQSSLPALVRLPLFLQLWGGFSLLMFVPVVFGWAYADYASARAFLYPAIFGLLGVTLVMLAIGGEARRNTVFMQLAGLLAAYLVLPAFLAIPMVDALELENPVWAYADMVSAMTTTGASIGGTRFALASETVHLWRVLVGWTGGLMIWVSASAILAPLSLGGFEVTSRGDLGRAVSVPDMSRSADPRLRVWSHFKTLTPVYTGLTALMAVLLIMSGDRPFVAISHAMSTLATSGISPIGGLENAGSGRAGEVIVFLFLIFALSRLTFSSDTVQAGYSRLDKDPEIRVGLVIVLSVTLLLFGRHWIASFDMGVQDNLDFAFRAFWGGLFTAMSYLTTSGFSSADWGEIRDWSGISAPGLILAGLALVGGGVATTAGGVKLLRIWVLYLNGLREMDKLVHPSSVISLGGGKSRIQRNGAFLAWVAFMLLGFSLAALSVGFSMVGLSFEDAFVVAISGLTTTGPLIDLAATSGVRLSEMPNAGLLLYCCAMVLGRLETLAIVALLVPDFWRN